MALQLPIIGVNDHTEVRHIYIHLRYHKEANTNVDTKLPHKYFKPFILNFLKIRWKRRLSENVDDKVYAIQQTVGVQYLPERVAETK